MALDVAGFKKVIATWVLQTLGPSIPVLWKNQGAPEPATYVSVWVVSVRPLGAVDGVETAYDEDEDRLRVTSTGARQLQLQIDVYSPTRAPPTDALSIGSHLFDSLRANAARELFAAADLSLVGVDETLVLGAVWESDQWVPRFSFEAGFLVESAHVELVDYFTSLRLVSDVDEIEPDLVQTIPLE